MRELWKPDGSAAYAVALEGLFALRSVAMRDRIFGKISWYPPEKTRFKPGIS